MADRIIIPGLSNEQNRALQAVFQKFDDEISELKREKGRAGVIEHDYSAKAGEFLNIEAPSAGLTITLPKSTQRLRNARVTMSFRNENPVRIVVTLGLINREAFVINTAIGTFDAVCDGIGGWSVMAGVTSSGSPTDARYVLGAAHASLPNAAVGTDSTEVDFSFTPGGIANWVLRAASVVLGRLQTIAPQRVLGNDLAVNSSPQEVTVHQELDWIPGSEGWIFDGVDDRIDCGNFNSFDRGNAFTLSAWVEYSTTGTQRELITKFNNLGGSSAAGYRLFISAADKPTFYIADNAVSSDLHVETTAAITATRHHVVATYSGNSLAAGVQLYVDGALVAKTTVGLGTVGGVCTNTNGFCLGGFDNTGSFAGLLTHCAVWPIELTAAQVAEVYGGGSPPDLLNLATTPDPQFWAKLDTNDTTGAGGINDYGTGNHDGTAEGGLALSTGTIGGLPMRGATLWQIIPPGTSGFPLCSNGFGGLLSYRQIAAGALPAYSAETFLGNFTAASAVPAARTGTSVAGAGLTYAAGGTLAVGASTSIAVNADDIQRAALTGDVTASQNSNATTIANNAVTNAKAADMASPRLKGRTTAATGDPEDLTLVNSTSNTWNTATGGSISVERAALTGDVTASANSNATTIANDAVTNAKAANMAQSTMKGRSEGSGTGDPEDLTTTQIEAILDGQAWSWAAAHTWAGTFDISADITGTIQWRCTSNILIESTAEEVTVQAENQVILASDVVDITGDDASDGFLRFDAATASTPTVGASQGMFWVEDPGAVDTIPRFTNDANEDLYLITGGDTLAHSGATSGNLGTISIGGLAPGGTFTLLGMTGAYQIEGFSGNNVQGMWFFIVGTSTQTGTLFHDDATATAANRLSLLAATDRVGTNLCAIAAYSSSRSRWIII